MLQGSQLTLLMSEIDENDAEIAIFLETEVRETLQYCCIGCPGVFEKIGEQKQYLASCTLSLLYLMLVL